MSTPQPPSQPGPDDSGRALSGIQRAGLVLIGVALLLIAFVVFRGSDDEGSTGRTTAAQTATEAQTGSATTATGDEGSSETGTTTAETETETETETTATTETQPARPAVPTIRVADGRPVGGVRRLSFQNGERIRFKVRSNVADEVHVHGYDVTKAVPAGQTVTFSFEATIEGRFEVELHDAGAQIAELEVTPS